MDQGSFIERILRHLRALRYHFSTSGPRPGVLLLVVVLPPVETKRDEMECRHRDLLGMPGEGFHTHSLGVDGTEKKVNLGFAVFDLLATVALSIAISRIFKISFVIVFVSLMTLAISLHWLFCVPTALNEFLGLTISGRR